MIELIDVPAVDRLADLEQACETQNDEQDFWRWVATEACRDIVQEVPKYVDDEWRSALIVLRGLRRRWFDWMDRTGEEFTADHEASDVAICGEINCFLNRVFNEPKQNEPEEEAMAATKRPKPETKEANHETNGHVLEPDPHFEQLKAKGKSRAKPAAGDDAQVNLLEGVEVLEERDIDFDKIIRSKLNPRQIFDEDMIRDMAPNIVNICRLNPITVREGTFELIDGETRHRSAEVAKVKQLRCKIVRCTDAQAATIRLQTSVQRRDLNPIEKAKALKILQEEHGYSQRQLAPIVNLQQGSIANLTRLLELPDKWQQRVISGEITASAARELVPYAKEAAVLDAMEGELEHCEPGEHALVIADNLHWIVDGNSRPLNDPYFYDRGKGNRNVRLNPTPEQRDALRVLKIKRHGEEHERCFNLELWEELQSADENARAARESKKADKASADGATEVDPAKARENAKKQKEIFNKKLYRFRTAWYQRLIVEAIGDNQLEEGDEVRLLLFLACRRDGAWDRSTIFAKRIRKHRGVGYEAEAASKNLKAALSLSALDAYTEAAKLLAEWFACNFESSDATLTPSLIHDVAEFMQLDLDATWRSDTSVTKEGFDPLADYLALMNKSQLVALAREWKLTLNEDRIESAKRSELAKSIADNGRGKPCPKALADAKAVQL